MSCLSKGTAPKGLDKPKKPEAPDRAPSPLKISCLDHILEAIDIEPVTYRIEYADGILPFQQFLEQLGDTGLAVVRLGQHLHNDVGDVVGGAGGGFEKSHPHPVDRFFGEIISQLLEIDPGVKRLS